MRITHQQYLNHHFPEGERNNITKLEFGNRGGKFPLKLEGFYNLTELILRDIKLTELDLTGCNNLEKITISNCVFDNPNIFRWLSHEKLKELIIDESEIKFEHLLSLAVPFKNLTVIRDGALVKSGEKQIQSQIVQRDI